MHQIYFLVFCLHYYHTSFLPLWRHDLQLFIFSFSIVSSLSWIDIPVITLFFLLCFSIAYIVKFTFVVSCFLSWFHHLLLRLCYLVLFFWFLLYIHVAPLLAAVLLNFLFVHSSLIIIFFSGHLAVFSQNPFPLVFYCQFLRSICCYSSRNIECFRYSTNVACCSAVYLLYPTLLYVLPT